MTLLAGKSLGDVRFLANFGLGVLPFPLQGDRQNDVLTGGLAFLWSAAEGVDVVGEVNGRMDVQGSTPVGTEDRGQARLGGRLEIGRLLGAGVRLDGGVVVGLADVDPGIGATLGLTLVDRSF
jgi:hypothetical protein